MNPAPDLDTIMDFEPQIEAGSRTVLAAIGINVDQVQVQQGTGDQKSGRVEVELTMGDHIAGCYHVPDDLPDGEVDTRALYESSWNAWLEFAVITNRDDGAQHHATYRRQVRVAMLKFFTLFSADVLPYHEISLASSAGTILGLMRAEQEDVSKLRYRLVVSVRDSAWPVTAPAPAAVG